MCLVIVGVANQSQTKSHISYCVTAKSHIIHTMGTHERNSIASSLTHKAGLKPMQLHWAPRYGVWVDCSFCQIHIALENSVETPCKFYC